MSRVNQNDRMVANFPDDMVDFRKIFWELYNYKWYILAAGVVTFVIAFFYTFGNIPQYKSTSLIQISSQSGNNILSNLGYKGNQTSQTDTELALLRTRYILEPIIKENALNIIADPIYFPVIGKQMAYHYNGSGLAHPFLGLSSYAWGGEIIQVKNFSIPQAYEGQSFQLIAGENNSYQLFTAQHELVLSGKAGEKSHATPAYSNFHLELAQLKAHPGTKFNITYQVPNAMVNQLSHQLQVKTIGNDANSSDMQDTGLIQLELTGSDPKAIERILNEITEYTVVKNIQQKAREAQKTLNFLHQRLPELKLDLERSENALNMYHIKTETMSMSTSNQFLLQRLNKMIDSLEKLRMQKEALLQIYTPAYPGVIATENQEIELKNKMSDLKEEIKKIPFANQEELNLIREVKIKNKMYEALLNNMHQLELIQAGLVGDVIALDKATPAVGIPSSKRSIELAGFFIGILLASILVIIKSILHKTVENSEQLEDELQIPIQAILPFSKKQRDMDKVPHAKPRALAKSDPDDLVIEGLRSLRISLYIQNPLVKQNIIAVTGSLSNIGKSFVTLNLAHVCADSDKRTLLIDADIRKGRLHETFAQPKTHGLSEYLEGQFDYDSLVRPVGNNLSFVSCGTYTKHPLELFQSHRFEELIQRAKQEFEQIIIDTPPILPVSDTMLIAKFCNIKLFVVSAASDHLADVKQAIKKASSHDINITGIVFNHRKPMPEFIGARSPYRYAYGTTN